LANPDGNALPSESRVSRCDRMGSTHRIVRTTPLRRARADIALILLSFG
jgi:hypothetical protein